MKSAKCKLISLSFAATVAADTFHFSLFILHFAFCILHFALPLAGHLMLAAQQELRPPEIV
jgi:hypothetical protein